MAFSIKKLFINKFTISFLLAILIVVAGVFLTIRWLDSYTHHGEQIVVPDLKNMSEKMAEAELKKKNLFYEISDSLYVKRMAPGAVVEQIPEAGEKVKEGRKIYLIINAKSPQKVKMPKYLDYSVRQVESMIKAAGLSVYKLEYVPSEFKGVVLSVKYQDRVIEEGESVNTGTPVTLVVGMGSSDEEVPVVSLRGLNETYAISRAQEAFFTIGSVNYDQPFDVNKKEDYMVYKQVPITGTITNMGKAINIFLTLDKEKLSEPEEVYSDSSVVVSPSTESIWE